MARKNKYSNEEFILAVKENLSYASVIRQLGLYVGGSNYETVKRKIKELNLDISHFTGQGWNTGDRYRPVTSPKPLSEILILNSTYTNTNSLRKRILNEELKECKCEICNNTHWLDQPIALELHHINGIKDDNRIENLQIVCPNCHAFTDNYRGKNIGLSAQEEISDVEGR